MHTLRLPGGSQCMSNTKDTVIKVRNLEEEKQNLLAQFEELKKLAEMKSMTLENEISAIKDQIESLKAVMGQEPCQNN